jgi:hypothetical protein
VTLSVEWTDLLDGVRNARIGFVTARPPGSPFATLDRRVIVTSPEEAVQLSHIGDVRVLDELARLLHDHDRAWAAVVILAALTRREEKLVESFASDPDEWWRALGQDAQARWSAWLSEKRDALAWDPGEQFFVET